MTLQWTLPIIAVAAFLETSGCATGHSELTADTAGIAATRQEVARLQEENRRLKDELQNPGERPEGASPGSAPAVETPGGAASEGPSDAYVIRPGDVVEVSVWKNKDLSRTVTVKPDGRISLPLLNEVDAGGLTALGLRAVLVHRLSEYVPSPEVSVIVLEVRSAQFTIMGEVKAPGRYDLQRRTSVLEAVAMAGGLTDFASPRRITIVRSEGGKSTKIPFDYKRATSADGEQEDILLRPGDIIVVP